MSTKVYNKGRSWVCGKDSTFTCFDSQQTGRNDPVE